MFPDNILILITIHEKDFSLTFLRWVYKQQYVYFSVGNNNIRWKLTVISCSRFVWLLRFFVYIWYTSTSAKVLAFCIRNWG